MTRIARYLSLLFLMSLVVATPLHALPQDPEPEDPTEEEATQDEEDESEDESEGRNRDRDGIQPYDEVITEEAVSDEGVFTVHRIGDEVHYEIPASELGREFLWVGRIAKTAVGQGYGGQKIDTRVVKWA